jgi:hypothetical protein
MLGKGLCYPANGLRFSRQSESLQQLSHSIRYRFLDGEFSYRVHYKLITKTHALEVE